jgi:N-terminal acetyltransferase B complex non-catalytic subunit
MYKQFQDERYLYWSIMCAILQVRVFDPNSSSQFDSHLRQANDPATPENIRSLLYNLAHRLVTSSPTPSYFSADRLFLHLTILRELRLFDDAYKLLSSDVGNYICSTSLVCNEMRREIWRSRGMFDDEAKSAREKIVEKQ